MPVKPDFISLPAAMNVYKQRAIEHQQTLRSIGALAGSNMADSLLGALGGIIIARFIGPEVIGQFRLFTIPLMYLAFLHLGTFDGLLRQIPYYRGLELPGQVEKVSAAIGSWNLRVTVLVSSAFFALALKAALQGNLADTAGWVSQAAAAVGIFYGSYLAATYRAHDRFMQFASFVMTQAAVSFCLVAAVVSWGFYGLCLRGAVPALVAVWLFHRARPLRMPLHFDLAALKETISIGLPLCFWGTIYSSLWVAAEYSLMLQFGGVTAVGLFSIAVLMRESLSILPQSVHQVFLPRFFEAAARAGGVRELSRRTFAVAAALALGMLAAVFVVSFVLDYFVPYFLPKYLEGLPLMKVCLGLAVFHATSLPLNGLIANGVSWPFGRGVLIGLLVFPLAVYLLNPLIGGIMAVAVGSLVGRLVRVLVSYVDLFLLLRRSGQAG